MNSVHEPCPKIDSETVLSQKLGQKPSQVHQHPTWPSWAHPSAHKPRACTPLARLHPARVPSAPRAPLLACLAPRALLPRLRAPAPACAQPRARRHVRPACASCLASAQMGSSPFQVLHFFFFFSFPLSSSYWKILKKIFIHIFFSHFPWPNKFIKFILSQFCSSFVHCKHFPKLFTTPRCYYFFFPKHTTFT